ncbi:MAG: hypothetical protein IPF52_17325 [Saprospiraceae bacterium]|nr:hypothetical protein [Saprospiraceae bacterium]
MSRILNFKYSLFSLIPAFLFVTFTFNSCNKEADTDLFIRKWKIKFIAEQPFDVSENDVKYIEFFENGSITFTAPEEEGSEKSQATWTWIEKDKKMMVILDGDTAEFEIIKVDKNNLWFIITEEGSEPYTVKCTAV